MTEQFKKFIPEKLQGSKELVRFGANAFGALFFGQAIGMDFSKVGLSPTIDVWISGLIFVIFWGAMTYVSNHQEEKKNGSK